MTDRTHVSPIGYLATLLALLALSVLTLALSSLALGAWALPVALLIASSKAILVALFFMHLVEQPAVNAFVAITAVALVAVLVGLTVADVVTRSASP